MPGRKFVFAHILLPHPPYIFDADGDMVVKATAETVPEADLYRDSSRTPIRRSGPPWRRSSPAPTSDPIIVVMGDEGPFLCRNVDCVDDSQRRLGIRFGALAAYYLPDQPAGFFPVDLTHVNTFRTLFSATSVRICRRCPTARMTGPTTTTCTTSSM